MREGGRVRGIDDRSVEDRREAVLLEHPPPRPLVREEAELGREADVRERHPVADEIRPPRMERPADPAEVRVERVARSRLDLGGDRAAEQRQ